MIRKNPILLEDMLSGNSKDDIVELLDLYGFRNLMETDSYYKIENLVDNSVFNNYRSIKGKLKRMAKINEWKDLFDEAYLESIVDNAKSLGTTFDDVANALDLVISRSAMNLYLLEDYYLAIPRKLLSTYGVAINKKNKGYHKGLIEDKDGNLKKLVLDGLKSQDLFEYLVSNQDSCFSEDPAFEESEILYGFDDATSALMAASTGSAKLLLDHGFKSQEKINSVDVDKLKAFHFRTMILLDSYDLDDFSGNKFGFYQQYIASSIDGNVDMLESFLDSINIDSDFIPVLSVFEGDYEKTKHFLEQTDKSSIESLKYAKNMLNISDIDELLYVAKDIDCKHKDIFEINETDISKFKKIRDEYEAFNERFVKATNLYATYKGFETLSDFDGDLRYFTYFDTDSVEQVKKISEKMSFERLDEVLTNSKIDKSVLLGFIEKGYDPKDVFDAFTGIEDRLYHVDDDYSLDENIVALSGEVNVDYVHKINRIIQASPYPDIPLGIASYLAHNNINPGMFKIFIEASDFIRYYKEDKVYDTVKIIRDITKVFNKTEKD